MIDELISYQLDPELIGLFHNIHTVSTPGHLGRGYAILAKDQNNKTVSLAQSVTYCDNTLKRPLWFVYSGMGSQWVGMGEQLMAIPIFAAAIERCHKVLEPLGLDIVHIITTKDKTVFDNILNSFVGIAAIQIGLTDILHEMGIKPDKIIGHSVGEVGCGYADGCLTAEETILAAYGRGLVSNSVKLIHGSMAAVGLGYSKMATLCPPGIEIACHNSAESCTISGPSDKIRQAVAMLSAHKVFVKEVPCSNIAYHSSFIKDLGPPLLKFLKDIIKNPKERSKRWLPTSIPHTEWYRPKSKLCSAEYYTNNLLNPVLFEETSLFIPANAVLIEIAPHGLLQAILRRALPDTCTNIPLAQRGNAKAVNFLLEAIGKIYSVGYNPKIEMLYPKIDYPVSTGTAHLSPLVQWVHDEIWSLAFYTSNSERSGTCKHLISIHDDEHRYLRGNVYGNKTFFPISGVLVLVWDTLSMQLGIPKRQSSVEYKDFFFNKQLQLQKNEVLKLEVQLNKGQGYFEVRNKDITIASGYVKLSDNKSDSIEKSKQEMSLNSDDVYKLLNDRGYYYGDEFKNILGINDDFTVADIRWNHNWITFLDAIFQIHILHRNHDEQSQPTFVRSLCIDNQMHSEMCSKYSNILQAIVSDNQAVIRCGGVSLRNVIFEDYPAEVSEPFQLNHLQFVPYQQNGRNEMRDSFNVFMQIVLENINKDMVNVVEIEQNDYNFEQGLGQIVGAFPNIKIIHSKITNASHISREVIEGAHLVLLKNLSVLGKNVEIFNKLLARDAFIITNGEIEANSLSTLKYRTVASALTEIGRVTLVSRSSSAIKPVSNSVSVMNEKDLLLLDKTLKKIRSDEPLLILSCYPPPSGLKELVQKTRRESPNCKIYVAMANHKISSEQYIQQIPNLGLTFNVLDHGNWGGFYFVRTKKLDSDIQSSVSLRGNSSDGKTLKWEKISNPDLKNNDITVHFAGLNCFDVNKSVGDTVCKFSDEYMSGFGMDYSGVTNSGKRVMGLIPSGAASTHVTATPDFLWPVPDHWTQEEAATVPFAYAYAFYCLVIRDNIVRGLKVLIDDATDAVGMAAISIALAYDCKVFAVVRDNRKKKFLQKVFPELSDSQIYSISNNAVKDAVYPDTQWAGCNIILSCSTGEFKTNLIKCCATHGSILDTKQILTNEKFNFQMTMLQIEANYKLINFMSIFDSNARNERKMIQYLISNGIAKGYVRPLNRVVYDPINAARALKLLTLNNHRGRVLLRIQKKDLTTEPKLVLTSSSCHLVIITQKMDMLGNQIINKLIASGTNNIVICQNSKYCQKDEMYTKTKLRFWQRKGINVKAMSTNMSNIDKIKSVIMESKNNGTIDGIYVIKSNLVDDTSKKEVANIVNNVNIASKEVLPAIKYFVVIGEDSYIGKDICIDRAAERLPSTFVSLPTLINTLDISEKQHTPEEYVLNYATAVDAMEAAVISKQVVLTVYSTKQNSKESLEYVERSSQSGKLATLFNYVDTDELMATVDIVFMRTLIQDELMCKDPFHNPERYLVIIPGLEGHYNKFTTICETLKIPAVVLQPGHDYPNENYTDMARRYIETMMKKLDPKGKFHLLGYSTGVAVALEMAGILESKGYEGTVFCIDGSPDTMPEQLERLLSDSGVTSEASLQDAILKHMYYLMTGESTQIRFSESATWAEKLHRCTQELHHRVTFSTQYTHDVINTIYCQILQNSRTSIMHHLTKRPLRSQIVLVRTESCHTVDDLGLSKYSQKPLKIYKLDSDHVSIIDDLRSSAIINRHIDPMAIKDFEKANICETYKLNIAPFVNVQVADQS